MRHSFPKWFRNSRPARDIVPISHFVDQHILATKSGGFCLCVSIQGIDPECMDADSLGEVSRRINSAKDAMPANAVLFEYMLKRRGFTIPTKGEYATAAATEATRERIEFLTNKNSLGSIALVWAIYIKPKNRKRKAAPDEYAAQSSGMIRELRKAAGMLMGQVGDLLAPRMLDANEVGQFFSYLLTLEQHLVVDEINPEKDVDQQLVGAAVQWDEHDTHLMVGKRHVQMFSLINRPKFTRPALYAALMNLNCEMALCSEWRAKDFGAVETEVDKQEGYIETNSASLRDRAANLGETPRRGARAIAAEKGTEKLGDVVASLHGGGARQGHYSLIGMVHSRDKAEIEEVMPRVHAIFRESKGKILDETRGSLSAYHSLLPGNGNCNVRCAWLEDRHYANMSLAYAPMLGTLESEALEDEYLAVYETRGTTPYFFDPFHEGNGNMIVIGAKRRGKSLNVNYLVDCDQKRGGWTTIYDIGFSYANVVLRHGGTVTQLGPDGPRMNPLAIAPTEENVHEVFLLVRLLLTQGGAKLEPEEEKNLRQKIVQTFALPAAARRLSSVILPARLQPYLDKWIGDGMYAKLFDNVEDELEMARIQAFDFQGLSTKHADLIEPVLYWITRRRNEIMHAPENIGLPKHEVFDEAWQHIRNPQMLEQIVSSGKTGGKHLSRITLLAHSPDDFGPNMTVLRNACPTIMFLGGPFDRAQYAAVFGVNERIMDLIASLQIGELLLYRASDSSAGQVGYAKVLRLNLAPERQLEASTRPKDIQKRLAAIKEHGREKGIRVLAATGGR